jgi:alpha-1,2-mannosyltransferase
MSTMRVSAPTHGTWWHVVSTGAVLSAAAVLMVGLFAATGSTKLGYDFRVAYLPAAESVVDGRSPYPAVTSEALTEERGYVYPPGLAIALAPLTVLPVDVAAVVGVLGCLAALFAALAVLEVRDVRCYAALLLWAPAWNALEMANVSAFLALGAALAWRLRATTSPVAIVVAATIAAKILLWPLLLWMVATRRSKQAALALALSAGLVLASWAAIGFRGVSDYPRILGEVHAERSYSIVGIFAELGFGRTVGESIAIVVGGALLVAVFAYGRRGEDAAAFTCAIVAALSITPVLWQHYLVLLAVPVAILRPRFSPIWLLPILGWVSPRAGHGDGLEVLVPAALVALVAFWGFTEARRSIAWKLNAP